MTDHSTAQRQRPNRSAARLRWLNRRMTRTLGPAGDRIALAQRGALALLVATVVLGSVMIGRKTAEEKVQTASADERAPLPPASARLESRGSAQAADAVSEARPTAASVAPAAAPPANAANPAVKEPSSASAPPSSPPPAPSFRDERSLPVVAAASSVVSPAEAADVEVPAFHDTRPLAAPSFKDARPVALPSLRDERAIVTPAPTPPPAAATAPVKAEDAGPKPFEVGYFLADRSPMVRQLEGDIVVIKDADGTSVKPAAPSEAPANDAAASTPAVSDADAGSNSADDGSLPTLVALAPGQLKIDGAACAPPDISTEPQDGGMMRMRITANCRAGEFVQISYGGAEFIRKLNPQGALDYNLDAFAGTSSAVEVRFADGLAKSVPVVANDMDKVSKIAVVWRAGVNLDLHVFEYAAKLQEQGHLWAQSPSTLVASRLQGQSESRGHGFLSSAEDDKTLGDKLEVYTFFHNDKQTAGAISLALDNETRGENPTGATCGQGALAEIDFQVSILPRRGQVARQSGVLTRVACGARLTSEARFNQSAMPGLRIRR